MRSIPALARALLIGVLMTTPTTATPQESPRINPTAKALADFREEVEEYLELHKKLAATLPEVPKEATPLQLDQRQRALAVLIQTARKGASPGDIFERDSRPVIRKLLHGIFASSDGKKLRATIADENPGPAVKLQVNGRYPDTIPVSSMPPQVLQALPPLPKELEYRFIGSTLILLDVQAHLIVDFMTGALPR
jgi:hypothetical protein